MTAKTWTYEEVQTELVFILDIDARHPGPSFNHDPACFATYCDMQAKHALQSGFPFAAMDIKQVQAQAARAAGETIYNKFGGDPLSWKA